jgi:asparagine synthase (glutamine-hydrolysing)
MCGIAGAIDFSGSRDAAALRRTAEAMSDAIANRGPDGSGAWSEPGIAVVHRRLAIVDLTPSGHQPMVSADGRWVITYNGEVYNAEDISGRLTGLARRGTSDTEIIVESVARRGIEATLPELNGIYAIALWDRAERTLHLVRDRLGVKPLFYARVDRELAFASELKSFAAAGLHFELDRASVASFLRFGYVPAPHSIWRNVAKVLPGEIVSVLPSGEVRKQRYWDLQTVAERGVRVPFAGDDSEAEERLHALLADAVSCNMVSDVPVGAFLSGGVDSSTVAALMVAAKRGPVRTFSIAFPDFGYDESAHARTVAAHLGTEHAELTVTAVEALNVVPELADMYDEPFADSSQIPTHLISKMTRADVTVALSGDGGDEVFAGYNRHAYAAGHAGAMTRLPLPLRRRAAAVLHSLPDAALAGLARGLPRSLRPSQPVDKLRKLADVLSLDDETAYLRLVSQYPEPASLTRGLEEHPVSWPKTGEGGLLERMQLADTATYLPDDILQKVDRAAMAVALEVRPPLLDHRVVEFAWALPRRMKIRDGETKWLLRRVLDRYVPRRLIERPKMGFAVPLADWLRGPLRDWAEDLLDPARLGGGLIDTTAVRLLWTEHLSGRRNWAYALWTILMYEAWRRRWAACSGSPTAHGAAAAAAL